MEYSSDFKYDLGVGKLKGETKLHTMLEDSKIEVKLFTAAGQPIAVQLY